MSAAALATRVATVRARLPRAGADVDRELAEALRVVAGATRSGSTLEQALLQAAARARGPVADAVRRAAAELALGVPVDRALEQLAARVRSEHAWLLARVVAAQHRRGGDLGALCHRLARLLHERRRLREEARSATAQARFTARAVLALPAILAGGWAMLSPASLVRLVTPASFLLALPALVTMALGIAVVRRVAAAAAAVDNAPAAAPRSGLLQRIAGSGGVRSQRLRLLGVVGGSAALLAALHPSPFVLLCAAAASLGAAWFPAAQHRRAEARIAAVADTGLPDVLETSIALLAAGCTPREAVEVTLAACPGELGAMLTPARQQIELGRPPFAALTSLAVVRSSPELEAWAFALTDGTRSGSPATSTLESLLRDVRAADRERFRTRAATAGPRIQLVIVLLVVPSIMWLMLVGAAQGLLQQLADAGIL